MFAFHDSLASIFRASDADDADLDYASDAATAAEVDAWNLNLKGLPVENSEYPSWMHRSQWSQAAEAKLLQLLQDEGGSGESGTDFGLKVVKYNEIEFLWLVLEFWFFWMITYH